MTMERDTQDGGLLQRTVKNRTVRIVILGLGALYIMAMFYGGGMKRQVKTLQALDEKRKVALREYRLSQMDLRLRLAAMQQLEGRRQVGLAVVSAQSGNATDAQKHVSDALHLLIDADGAETSNADLSDEIVELQKLEKGGATPESLTSIAAQMDAALDKQIPGIIRTATIDDKAHPIVPPTMNDVPQLPGNDVTNPGPDSK